MDRAAQLTAPRQLQDDGLLSSGRRHWCATGAKDDGKQFAASQARPVLPDANFTIRLTPFGAYAIDPALPDTLRVYEVVDRYRALRRKGDTGRLAPCGPTVLRADPDTALQPGGSVFVGQRSRGVRTMPTAKEWASVPTTVQIGARAQGLVPPGAHQACAVAPDAGNPVVGPEDESSVPTREDVNIKALAALGTLEDPCDCASLYECTLVNKVVIDYAGYKLCVPERWYWTHVEYDDWMSEEDTFATLWGGVNRHGSGVDSWKMDDLVGCWMIDTAKDRTGRSYNLFFSEANAPMQFLYRTLDLIRRYSGEITDWSPDLNAHWSGVDTCDGLGDYVHTVLGGGKGKRVTGGDSCTVEFRVVSRHSFLPDKRAKKTCGGDSDDISCGNFGQFEPDGAFDGWQPFDDWQQVLESRALDHGRPIYRLYVWNSKGIPVTVPETGDFLAHAGIGPSAVALPAGPVAFRGLLFDFSMYWARVALQFAFERENWNAWYGSWVYARTSLSAMVESGGDIIHELGHDHMGVRGHCTAGDLNTACCFDIAAQHWKCAVAHLLGLADTGTLRCTGDGILNDPKHLCGGEDVAVGEVNTHYELSCVRWELCTPLAEPYSFSAGRCS